jgi:transcriptional regulator with XRE-family HTH domain
LERFHVLLREARRSVGITQRDLARLAHVSRSSLLAYELQRRHPTRETLSRVLDALGVDVQRRNELLAAAGYAIEEGGNRFHADALTLEEAAASVESRPWVCFLLNEVIEVRAMSAAARALWGVGDDLLEYPARRNLLAMLTQPWYADCIGNWDEAAAFHIALFKSRLAPGASESPGAYVASVLDEAERGRPKLVTRFFELWESTRPSAREWTSSWYDMAWKHDGERLRFHVLNNIINEQDALYTSDWLPADERTYHHVAAMPASTAGRKRSAPRRSR